jgi:adenine-specific DNA-methyltransferase
MARIEEKNAEIADPALRQAIDEEVKALKKNKQFGLVFETHSPEVVPMPRVPVKRDATVAKKAGKLTEVWQVVRLQGDTAELVRTGSDGKPVHDTAVVDSLLVVRRMAEPIFPALKPVNSVQNGESPAPHHILIEADNYHALQLLTYAYAGKVDCIYIDPPYNTGARDWKYNNDYVDSADQWRHSKWLTFMEKRLQLAKRLLNQQAGVLVVTIDEHEVHHLACLLAETFPDAKRQMVTIVNNGAGVSQGGFYRVEEYAFFCFLNNATPFPISDDLLSEMGSTYVTPYWFSLIRYGGINALPSKRGGLVYPIGIDKATGKIAGCGRTLKARIQSGEITGPVDEWKPDPTETLDGHTVVWPFRGNGQLSTWQLAPETLMALEREGFVRVQLQKNGPGGNQWSINYVKSGNQRKVRNGEIPVTGRDDQGVYILGQIARNVVPKTVWRRAKHDAGKWGSRSIREVLGNVDFDYAKSPYAVLDCLATAVGGKPNSLVVDFFAGSGTTLNAINLLNAADGGRRQCILVTNNEVSEAKARTLTMQGAQPGDPAWDAAGICNSVTWPRNKFTILGRRDDGTALEGEYQTGRIVSKEKARNIRQLGFAEGRAMTLPQRKQLASLMPALPQSKLAAGAPWFLDEDLPVSVLWDVQQAEAWLEELSEADHLTDIYVVTTENKLFTALAKAIKETLGSLTVEEDEKRPMADGFPANLDYFKLEFLEPSAVALGRQFEGILPILWMMAGSRGPCPLTPENGYAHLHWLIPDVNPFAVLMRETRFREFQARLAARPDLTHIFLVTNSDKAFHDMKADLPDHLTVTQLYKSYLDNFKINTQQV